MTSQDGHILQQHMNNRFTRATQTARQTTGNPQRPISDDIVRRQLVTNNTICCSPTIEPIRTICYRQERLQWDMQRQN